MTSTFKGLSKAFMPTTIIKDLTSLSYIQLASLFSMISIMVGLSLYWGDSAIGIVAGITGVTCVVS